MNISPLTNLQNNNNFLDPNAVNEQTSEIFPEDFPFPQDITPPHYSDYSPFGYLTLQQTTRPNQYDLRGTIRAYGETKIPNDIKPLLARDKALLVSDLPKLRAFTKIYDILTVWVELAKATSLALPFDITGKDFWSDFQNLYHTAKGVIEWCENHKDELSVITKLDLSHKILTHLPIEVCNLPALEILNLEDNNLTSLPPEIDHLRTLRILLLRDNYLIKLPSKIGKVESLVRLDLSKNSLTSLHHKISNLKDLVWLDLSENKLSWLPATFGQLKALGRLWLNNNLFKNPTLKTDGLQPLSGLQNLRELMLWGNDFTRVPPVIFKLNLEKLSLGNNELKNIPPGICGLQNLTSLDLRCNNFWLTESHNSWLTNKKSPAILPPKFSKLKTLTELKLGGNSLSELPTVILKLPRLKTLDLSNNNLTSLPFETVNLTALTTLELTNNPLACLPFGFAWPPNLEDIPEILIDESPLPLKKSKLENGIIKEK